MCATIMLGKAVTKPLMKILIKRTGKLMEMIPWYMYFPDRLTEARGCCKVLSCLFWMVPAFRCKTHKSSTIQLIVHHITKTCPCNVYPLEPHFYIAKLGYAGVYLFFLFLLQNIDCGYSLEPPRQGGSYVYPQSMF